ncbi:GntR family transcriptional regulator [Microbacterium hydrocarbonoxydans]|uniref:DNA-binding transcriptional regulator, GntR family n=1 Tax=Microbacterium hydrocarbonoxydans TaxID=273678 RepID=A0A1H4MBA7_9MICO|nr:GntR family transcriptional regulator [Microbacterium hydrocarbonoxydans]SEB80371.1 DNA-binding transcriptional regulator, GntR family [Microbacterium hydrocarbonoxydans]
MVSTLSMGNDRGPVSGARPLTMHPAGAPLSSIVFRHVGAQIAEGVLPPGLPIDDRIIGDELGVSRTPVREGLQRLERIGLVEFSPGRFTRVTPLTAQDVQDWYVFAGTQVVALIDAVVANLEESIRLHAASIVDEVARHVDEPEHFTRSYLTLYNYLLAQGGTSVHRTILGETTFALARALRAGTHDADTSGLTAQHLRLLGDALRSGDRDLAVDSARAVHLALGRTTEGGRRTP